MVRNVKVNDAADALHELIQFVQKGNEVVLMDAGRAVARLTAVEQEKPKPDGSDDAQDKWTTDDFNFNV
jgi:antitoxin (DNA-binding transcriptional repressor) of toxin-antitoxin stability system